MNYLTNLLFFQDGGGGDNTTIWIALVSALSTLLVALFGGGGLFLWYLNRHKQQAEVAGQIGKNEEQDIKNFEFENVVLDKAKGIITDLRQKNLELDADNHALKATIQIKNLEIAKEKGKVELALKERDSVFEKIDELEQKINFEHNNCQQQIIEIGLKYEHQLSFCKNHIQSLGEFLTEKGYTVPDFTIPPFSFDNRGQSGNVQT